MYGYSSILRRIRRSGKRTFQIQGGCHVLLWHKMPADESSLIQIFKINGITANDISLRSNVVYSVFDSGYVKLECISAWSPPYEAYSRLAESFGISFVLQAEEPGFSVYINTDMDKKFLTVEYKVYLRERPEDHSLDSLFHHAGGDTDFYFDSDGELLERLKKYSADLKNQVVAKDEKLQKLGHKEYLKQK